MRTQEFTNIRGVQALIVNLHILIYITVLTDHRPRHALPTSTSLVHGAGNYKIRIPYEV
eukprot:SAG31_NODE_43803_length_265_cov_0.933735_1_plen_58_part_01